MREPHSEQWTPEDGVAPASSIEMSGERIPPSERLLDVSERRVTLLERSSMKAADVVGRLSRSISATMAANPNATRLCVAAIFAILIAFSLKHVAHADPANRITVRDGIQSEIDYAFNFSEEFNVFSNSIQLAQYLFASLAAMTVLYSVVAYYIRNQTIKGLAQRVLTLILSLGFPFVIITTATTVLPTIVFVGLQIADVVTGNPDSNISFLTDPSPDNIQTTLSDIYNQTFGAESNTTVTINPKTIVNEGVQLAWPLLKKVQADTAKNQGSNSQTGNSGTGNNESVESQNQMIVGFILALALAIIGTFVFIAVELVIAFFQIYLILPVAAFSLGFLGSPATASFGNGYWRVVLQALLKFVTIVFVIGFAIAVAEHFRVYLNSNLPATTAPSPGDNGMTDDNVLKMAISTAVLSVSLLYIVRALPGLFGAVLSGAEIGAGSVKGEFEGAAATRGGLPGGASMGSFMRRTGRDPIPRR